MRFVRRLKDDSPRSQVGDELRRLIVAEGLRVGDPLPTYREICRLLGASLLTVQRAMNDLAAEGLVYRLRSRGTYVAKRVVERHPRLSRVGVITYTSRLYLLEPGYVNEIMRGILAVCEQDGLDLNILSVVANGIDIQPREVAAGADGIILVGIINDAYIAALARERIPLVVADYLTDKLPLDYVVCDNAQATRMNMAHLFKLGHRRILYLDGVAHDPLRRGRSDRARADSDVVERRAAYLRAMKRRGLEDLAAVCRFEHPGARGKLLRSLTKGPAKSRPTAVLSDGYETADFFLSQIGKLGIRVPDDLSLAVVATPSTPLSERIEGLTLTSSRFVFQEMGEKAVRLLEKRAGGSIPTRATAFRIGATFHPGETTRPPAG